MAELLGEVESNVLRATDRDVHDFRAMQMEQCSLTGLAAALVAQIASSTLQLQYMPTIHWIVPALCTSSLILGLLSVSYSFRLHYLLTKYTCAQRMRTAFTWAPGGGEGGGGGSGDGGEEGRERGGGDEGPGSVRPSYVATFTLWFPLILARLAILSYLVAIVLYWGVAAKMNLQESRARSTNVGFLFLTHHLNFVLTLSF